MKTHRIPMILLLLLVVMIASAATAELKLPTPAEFPASGSPEFSGPFLESGSEPQYDEMHYVSENVSISITGMRYESTDVYVADLYVRSLDCLCRSYKNNKWDAGTLNVSKHAEQSGALLAVTGDSSAVFKNGLIVGNGKVWRNKSNTKRDLGVLWRDGSFDVYTGKEVSTQKIGERSEEIWQTFLFGPFLLDREDGHALTKKELTNAGVSPVNPRSIFGYYEPGHYCLVLVDGRKTASKLEKGKKNFGLNIENTAKLMESLGVKQAYNLDGGQSAKLVFLGQTVSTPFRNGRRIGDAVVVIDVAPKAIETEKPDTVITIQDAEP